MPLAEIHYLTKAQYLPLLNANPNIDKVYTIHRKVSEVIAELKAEDYDVIIDLHKNIRSSQVKLMLGKERHTFDKLNRKKWLLTALKLNLLPEIHLVERYFKAVRKLGITYDRAGLDYFIPEQDVIAIEDVFPENFYQGFVALVVGSKQQTKQIPVRKMQEICKKVNRPVVLLGGESDIEKAYEVAAICPEKIVNACGIFNINQSASVLQQAQVVVTPDTGLMHIAAAFRKPIVVIWGNTIPEFGMYPLFPKGEENFRNIQVLDLSCRPCSKLGFDACPKNHFKCMNDISVDEVLKGISEVI
jgi:ADP-heptose:LPS heptosyltransferase